MTQDEKLTEIRKYIVSHLNEGYFITKDHKYVGNVYVDSDVSKYKTIDGFYDNILPRWIA